MERGRTDPSAPGAILQIVGRAAAESDGVVGIAPRTGGRVGELLPVDDLARGVAVSAAEGDTLRIEVHVVVEYGLDLGEVARTLRRRIASEVARLTDVEVASVAVHVEDVRRST